MNAKTIPASDYFGNRTILTRRNCANIYNTNQNIFIIIIKERMEKESD